MTEHDPPHYSGQSAWSQMTTRQQMGLGVVMLTILLLGIAIVWWAL